MYTNENPENIRFTIVRHPFERLVRHDTNIFHLKISLDPSYRNQSNINKWWWSVFIYSRSATCGARRATTRWLCSGGCGYTKPWSMTGRSWVAPTVKSFKKNLMTTILGSVYSNRRDCKYCAILKLRSGNMFCDSTTYVSVYKCIAVDNTISMPTHVWILS